MLMRRSILPNSMSYSDLKNLFNDNVKEVKRTQIVPLIEEKEEPFYFVYNDNADVVRFLFCV